MFGLSPLDRDLGWDEGGEQGPIACPVWLRKLTKMGGLGSNNDSIGFNKTSVNEHEVFNI